MTFSDDNSDSDEGDGKQKGQNSDRDPKFGASFTPSEPHLLKQEDLNNAVCDFIMSEKTSSTRSFPNKRL
jgi:hypothetical protein